MPEYMYRIWLLGHPVFFETYSAAVEFTATYGIDSPIMLIDTHCDRCMNAVAPTPEMGGDVPHNNCMYDGMRIGHSSSHCTADACW